MKRLSMVLTCSVAACLTLSVQIAFSHVSIKSDPHSTKIGHCALGGMRASTRLYMTLDCRFNKKVF